MTPRHALRDDQWERIQDLLPGRVGHVGVTARDNRLFVEAVLYRYKTGIPWRDLPERFGDFRGVHLRFSRWRQSGVWPRIFTLFAQDADHEWGRIDSTIVRAHQHSAGAIQREPEECQAIGLSRGGLSTKIHATTDALGHPTGVHLTPGQAHDLVGADELLANTQADAILADKAYDAQERLIDPLEKAGKPEPLAKLPGSELLRHTLRPLGASFLAEEVSLADRLTHWHVFPDSVRTLSCLIEGIGIGEAMRAVILVIASTGRRTAPGCQTSSGPSLWYCP